jgi:hypothetical protein
MLGKVTTTIQFSQKTIRHLGQHSFLNTNEFHIIIFNNFSKNVKKNLFSSPLPFHIKPAMKSIWGISILTSLSSSSSVNFGTYPQFTRTRCMNNTKLFLRTSTKFFAFHSHPNLVSGFFIRYINKTLIFQLTVFLLPI